MSGTTHRPALRRVLVQAAGRQVRGLLRIAPRPTARRATPTARSACWASSAPTTPRTSRCERRSTRSSRAAATAWPTSTTHPTTSRPRRPRSRRAWPRCARTPKRPRSCVCATRSARQFVYEEMQQQNYYPENVYAGHRLHRPRRVRPELHGRRRRVRPAPTACSRRRSGCQAPNHASPSARTAPSGCGPRAADPDRRPSPGAEVDWDYYQLIASLLQGAGPNLNPANVEQGAFAAGTRGGGDTGHVLRGFAPGSYAWNQDMAISYFDPKKPSSFNGKPGTFVRLGKRITVGGYGPTLPPIPADR